MEESLTSSLEKKLKSIFGDLLLALVFSFIRPIATLTEPFLRKQMGERYFNAWNYIAGLALIYASRSPYGLVSYKQMPVANTFAVLWALGFLICIFMHKWGISERYQNNNRWHSYNYGIKRFERLPVAVERIIPIAFGIIFVLMKFWGIGGMLILSGAVSISLRIREIQEFRNRMLDKIDAQIEHDNLDKAILEKLPPQQTEGLRAPVPRSMSREAREQYIRPKGSAIKSDSNNV